MTEQRLTTGLQAIALTLALALSTPWAAAAPPEPAYAGVDVRAEADAAELGLPIYPGARRPPVDGDEKTAVTLGIWGGSLGFRVTVLKLLSPDPVGTIGEYYRTALARYGAVMDCGVVGRQADAGCEDDKPPPGGRLYKVEAGKVTRVVSLKPQDGEVLIQLVRVATGRAAAAR
jgi:hypothetical protein